MKPSQIASKLDFHKSIVSRELKCGQAAYAANLAQKHDDQKTKQKGKKSCLTPELKEEIEQGLTASWSPEQIYARF